MSKIDIVKFIIGRSSPAVQEKENRNDCKNNRQKMYKASENNAKKTKIRRSLHHVMHQKSKKDKLIHARREIPTNLEEEFEDEVEDQKPIEPPKLSKLSKKEQAVAERRRQLEEFQRQKTMKKKAEEKTKKPPFRAGSFKGYSQKASFSWADRTKNSVYVFKGNSTRTVEPSIVKMEKQKGTANLAAVKKGPSKPKNVMTKKVAKADQIEKRLKVTDDSKPTESKLDATFTATSTEAGNGEKQLTSTPEKNSVSPFELNPVEPKLLSTVKTDLIQFTPTTPKNKKVNAQSPDYAEEARDKVSDLIFKTPTPRTPLNLRRTPLLMHSPLATTPVRVIPKICIERGTSSDKRKSKKTPAELLEIDHLFPEQENNGSSPNVKPLIQLNGCEIAMEAKEPMEAAKDVEYFKKVLGETSEKLNKLCYLWNEKMESVKDKFSGNRYEDICGKIRSAIGKANLLMNKKGRFEQFRSLIENCEFGLGEKKTTCMDLQGFWEMIYYQVEDIEQLFKDLSKLEENNWVQEDVGPAAKAVVKKKVVKKAPTKPKTSAGPSSKLKEMMMAKRKAMQANKSQNLDVPPANEISEAVSFDAGFFQIEGTPKKTSPNPSPKKIQIIHSDKVLLNSLKKDLMKMRISSSAGNSSTQTPFAVIAATNAIRRSISRENTPVVKSQLEYSDDEDEKENVPSTPSKRVDPVIASGKKEKHLGTKLVRRSERLSMTPRKSYKD